MRLHRTVKAIAVGQVRREVRAPLHARAGHAKAVEHSGLRFLPNIQAEAFLEYQLEDVEAFARIPITCAGIVMKAQTSVWLKRTEVSETGGMREKYPWSQRAPATIAREIGMVGVRRQGARQQVSDAPYMIVCVVSGSLRSALRAP